MKKQSPNIAIILVNYNGYKDTIECIESLEKSSYKNYTVIVVDNKSTDDSVSKLQAIQSEKPFVLLEAVSNNGFSAGNNVGIAYAIEHEFDYVLLLNNDTLVDEDFLFQLLRTEQELDNHVIVTSKIYFAYDKNILWYAGGRLNPITSRTEHIGIHEKDSGQYDEQKTVSLMSGCCMFIPTEAIKEVGYMEEDYFLYCEDTDYGCRFINNGYDLVYQPKSVLYHKVNASTGKMSDLICYYTVRNKFYIIQRFISRKYRVVAYFYVLAETVKRLIGKEYSTKAVRRALVDFARGKKGKTF